MCRVLVYVPLEVFVNPKTDKNKRASLVFDVVYRMRHVAFVCTALASYLKLLKEE